MRPHPTHDILLVDPDLELRRCRALYLQMRGFRVAGARAADDTLLRLRAGFRPCVMLVDPRRADTTVWDLVDYLRADSVLATVPLVLVTYGAAETVRAEGHGVDECIAPPSEPQRLVAAIERQCRRRSGSPFASSEGAIRPQNPMLPRRVHAPEAFAPPSPAPPVVRRLG